MGVDSAGSAVAAPPWHCRVEALLWLGRADPRAAALVPEALRRVRRRPPRLVVGGLVRYVDSPVGPYRELFVALALRPALVTGHVVVMAVDSLASARAGREGWALPKTVAAFAGEPTHWVGDPTDSVGEPTGPGREPTDPGRELTHSAGTRVESGGWRVVVRASARGPALPAAAAARAAQVWPGGRVRRFGVVLTGTARAALVEVAVSGDESAAVPLRSGRHLAVHWPSARLRVRAPEP